MDAPVASLSAACLIFFFVGISSAQTLRVGVPGPSTGLTSPGRFPGIGTEGRLESWLADPALGGYGSLAPRAAAPVVTGAAAFAEAPSPASALRRLRRIEEQARRLPRHVKALDARRREELFRALAGHPVAGLEHLGRYDPTGEIGFCFGRAMAAHLLALRMGLPPDSVRKIFVVGDLRSEEGVAWRFHVAALVRGTDGRWYAVDPIAPGPLELGGWARFIQDGYDKERRARFYLTEADAVMPDLDVVPAPGSESGERLIELSFEPEGREGFEKLSGLPDARGRVFRVRGDAVGRYFDTTRKGRESFDLLRAVVNGMEFHYRGYFTDLFDALFLQPAPGAACSLRGPACGAAGAVRAYSPPPIGGLFSPRMASW